MDTPSETLWDKLREGCASALLILILTFYLYPELLFRILAWLFKSPG